MSKRKVTDMIVIHCSATRPEMDIDAEEIRRWHKAKGWSDIGYHFVIKRNGEIENGRPIEEIGSHVAGHNWHTVAVCLVGGVDARNRAECNFSEAQWQSLQQIIKRLRKRFGNIPVRGHHDLFAGKDCPSFNVEAWARENGFED